MTKAYAEFEVVVEVPRSKYGLDAGEVLGGGVATGATARG